MPRRLTFFFYSLHGDSVFLARRLQQDGHSVSVYYPEPAARFIGRGIVPIATQPDPPRGSIVIVDGVGASRFGSVLRRRGYSVLGGNSLEKIETSRETGARVMRSRHVVTPPTETFTSLADARKFLHKQDDSQKWYFKPDGLDVPKAMTRNGSPEMLLRFLDYAEPQLRGVPAFILQSQVDGTEISCCYWFNGNVVGADATIEEKKFGTGDTGPATGCQSNIVWDVPTEGPLALATIGNFVEELATTDYVGMLDLNSIIADDGSVYGLEFTARLGYDCTQAWAMLFDHTLGEQIADFAAGHLRQWERNTDDFAMTLRLSTPPQPMEDTKDDTKLRGLPLDAKLLDDPMFFPDDIMLARGEPVMASGSGMIGVVGAVGKSLPALRKELLARIEDYEVPDLMYRTDPVSRAEKDLKKLRVLGLLPVNILRASESVDDAVEDALECARRISENDLRSGGSGSHGGANDDSDEGQSPPSGPVTDLGNTGFSEPAGMDAVSGDNAGDTGPTSAGGPT